MYILNYRIKLQTLGWKAKNKYWCKYNERYSTIKYSKIFINNLFILIIILKKKLWLHSSIGKFFQTIISCSAKYPKCKNVFKFIKKPYFFKREVASSGFLLAISTQSAVSNTCLNEFFSWKFIFFKRIEFF